MKITEHKPEGVFERNATETELHKAAGNGNREAMREIIDEKGGWEKLTPKDKDETLKNLIGYGEV